jgi:hypothetical protein
MPRLASTTPRRFTTLRSLIKQQHGVGWSICEQSGRIKLSRRWKDAVELQNKAMAFGLSAAAMEPLPSEDAIDWHELVARFRKHKTSDTGECRLDSFDRNYGLKMQQFLEVVRRRPIPRDARTTLASRGCGTSPPVRRPSAGRGGWGSACQDHHALQDCTATRRSRRQTPGSSPTRIGDDGSHEICEPAKPR